ncbi:hypothetical protein DUT91_18770 [Phyllobacterium salinisoli]|uniref:DUF3426 domain-containing protein n=1 Tax=Phyllobacterium salinisoli TaxID=1899321 RepID=A0A368JZP6_9HYPH|nr:hypothetical protein [Phyllobacterium salinisoli]RCS22441.1 hypothetical protein DUT91_18770 [Phyllobacterium salinisoli]
MAEIARKRIPETSGFGTDGTVEDAEFWSVVSQDAGLREKPVSLAPILRQPNQLSILKTGTRNHFASDQAGLPGAAYWVLVLLTAFGAFWMTGGHVVAAYLLASQTGPDGMKLSHINTRIEAHGGREVIFVAATVRNEGLRPDPVPEIAVTVEGRTGAKRDHYLGTRGLTIGPGESLTFSSRLPALEDGVKTVGVRLSR